MTVTLSALPTVQTDTDSIQPFANITITDSDPNATIVAYLTVQASLATSNPNAFSVDDFSSPTSAPLVESAAPRFEQLNSAWTTNQYQTQAQLQSELRSLQLTVNSIFPALGGTAGPQNVTLGVMDNHGDTASVSTYIIDPPPAEFIVENFSTSSYGATVALGTQYTGSRPGITSEYAPVTHDNLYIYSNSPNVFVYGQGNDIINLQGDAGTNVLDAGHGNDTLIGGTGQNTFVVEGNTAIHTVSDIIQQFHAGDAIDIWGIPKSGGANSVYFTNDADGSGLTVKAVGPGHPSVSVDIKGYTTADISAGRITTTYSNAQGAEMIITGH